MHDCQSSVLCKYLSSLSAGTQGDVLQCTCGFMSLERLITLQKPLMERDLQQRIFPQINFTCDGIITKWIVGACQSTIFTSDDYYPELQIWRNSGNDAYTKVGNTPPGDATPFLQGVAPNVYEYTPDPPLEFKAGDILGVFQPWVLLSHLMVYNVNDGPTSFGVYVGLQDTEPLLDTFTLTQSGVLISSDLPLITVEIGKYEIHQRCMYNGILMHSSQYSCVNTTRECGHHLNYHTAVIYSHKTKY